MCDCGLDESVYHIIVKCKAYEQERNKLMHIIISEMSNKLFMSWDESEVESMCTLLGMDGNVTFRVFEAVKELLVIAWKTWPLHGEALASRVVRREHTYIL